jgi:hypothetical protein
VRVPDQGHRDHLRRAVNRIRPIIDEERANEIFFKRRLEYENAGPDLNNVPEQGRTFGLSSAEQTNAAKINFVAPHNRCDIWGQPTSELRHGGRVFCRSCCHAGVRFPRASIQGNPYQSIRLTLNQMLGNVSLVVTYMKATYSTSEVAFQIGVSKRTLVRWLRDGKIDEPKRIEYPGIISRLWNERDIQELQKYKEQHYRKGRGRKKKV